MKILLSFAMIRCRRLFPFAVIIFLLFQSGCASIMSSATTEMTNNLARAILNNNDLETVEQGAPAYLLMIDSLIESDPKSDSLLIAGATLYTAYTDVFVQDTERKKRLTDKGMKYASRAVCLRKSDACDLRSISFQDFSAIVSKMSKADVPALFALGSAWAAWIQARQDNWDGIAEISRIETLMERVVQLDEHYKDGTAHMYLGMIRTLLPPAAGGKPEIGKSHFEKAMHMFEGNLMTRVLYAKQYARMVFDRELHDRLLKEVLNADPNVNNYVLSNTLAQQLAKELIENAEDFF